MRPQILLTLPPLQVSEENIDERLDASVKRILQQNRRMAEELRLHVQETDELQRERKVPEGEHGGPGASALEGENARLVLSPIPWCIPCTCLNLCTQHHGTRAWDQPSVPRTMGPGPGIKPLYPAPWDPGRGSSSRCVSC